MAVAIAHLVSAEVLVVVGAVMFVPMFAAMGIFAVPPIVAVEVVIHVTPEVGWTVVPGSRPYKDAARKPFRPIVAVGSAIIRRIVEITVRALRRRPDLYRDLCVCLLG